MVDEADGPLEKGNKAIEDTEEDVSGNITLLALRGLLKGYGLSEHLNDADDQRSETDAAIRVGDGPSESASSGARRHPTGLSGAKVPTSIYPGDGGMKGLSNPLGYPETGKCHEDHQPDHLTTRAASSSLMTGWVATVGMIFDVDGRQRDRPPGAKSKRDDTTDQRRGEDPAMMLGHIHDGLQHQHTKGDARDPADETNDVEDRKDQEHDGGRVIMTHEIDNGGADTEDDLQDTGDPNELLGERPRKGEVDIAKDEGRAEDKSEQNNGVGRETKFIGAAIDAATIETLGNSISLDREA